MPHNKDWAQNYLLDPLTAPEPSQVHAYDLRQPVPQHYNTPSHHRKSSSSSKRRSSSSTAPKSSQPGNSPARSDFHPSNPFSSIHQDHVLRESRPPLSFRSRPMSAKSPPPQHQQTSTSTSTSSHQRHTSLPERFPGDMSSRPLDVIKKETKTADRHRRHRSHNSHTDTIDALDTIGGTYHHGGPYDATLASRNTHRKYSPVYAVRESNREAIRATPREYIQDSLKKHVPLQGTATIPPGELSLDGRVMKYREGADLMREADAPGGAYKRWDGLTYHPDDLKGKSEPSYTIEREAREAKRRDRMLHPAGGVEMQPRRQPSPEDGAGAMSSSMNYALGQQNSTSRRLSDGLKRRFGSLRRKKDVFVD